MYDMLPGQGSGKERGMQGSLNTQHQRMSPANERKDEDQAKRRLKRTKAVGVCRSANIKLTFKLEFQLLT